jgi:dTDP-4-amino-4,6-dideoxygalactose transaminase
VLLGSGTAAIYLGLMAARLPRNSVVLVPNICCISPVLAIQWAGLRPCFVDVDSETLTISLESVEAAMGRQPVQAVIAVHLFGQACKITELEDMCRARQILLIEDCAQSLGGRIGRRKLGSFGDFSIISFGYGKTVELGHGGALVSDSPELMEMVRRLQSRLPPYDEIFYKKARSTRRWLYFRIEALAKTFPFGRKLTRLFRLFKSHYLFGFDKSRTESLKQSLTNLEANFLIRRSVAESYMSRLRRERFRLPTADLDNEVLTRFAIEADDADGLATMLRSNGINASIGYPCLSSIFSNACTNHIQLYVSEKLSGRFITLWTNSDGERDLEQTISLLNG